ncbi:MAG: FkbM family methyltransferase [Gammaproteobacteria bacterium]|nr:FkbM family methyltransferase [Gammaproteobacteria bacterium]
MLFNSKLKELLKKIFPFWLLRHINILSKIFFQSGKINHLFSSLYNYLKWFLYNKPFNKTAIAHLINNKKTLVYPDSDSGVSDLLLLNEYKHLKFIRSQLPENAFVIDAGCNVGNRTLSLSDKISGALMIDANSLSLSRAKDNFQLNNLDLERFHQVHAAVGEKSGEIYFTDLGGTSTKNKAVLIDDTIKNNENVVKVLMTTIDIEMKKLGNPDCHFIKTDVEGNDLLALKGAINTITNNSTKLIMFERWESIPIDDFIHFFEKISWQVFTINNDLQKCFDKSIMNQCNNLFAEPI